MRRILKTVAWLLGLFLIAIGILNVIDEAAFGLFPVETTHNIFDITLGILAIIAALSGESIARLYLIVAGLIYAALAVMGFMLGGDAFGFFALSQTDNYLHTILAIIALSVGFRGKK